MPLSPELLELTKKYRISTSFDDWQGRTVEVPEETVRAILTAMGAEEGKRTPLVRRSSPRTSSASPHR
ncbi:hypothetical protein [Naasia aerilata]|uniref:Uncharacterized protein n=1 Tax=Naasia aerilata TaxID=1162966 RepID=A0ABM8GES9_9MICO|nr:hypothetical protein [Naasia aerilata]BDZ46826.1 hypothetical protein GCM10025866_27350 [Naasia aerilata]